MDLEPGKLTWEALLTLAPDIRYEDLVECEGRPYDAILRGSLPNGDAWVALSPDRPLGVFGYSADSARCWSLWTKLSRPEALAILRHTPLWAHTMVRQSGLPKLHNYVHTQNLPAIKWLEASGCFDINWTPTRDPKGTTTLPVYYFETTPKMAAPHV